MKIGTKAFLFGFLFLTAASSPVLAQENASWIQKMKSFFKKPEVEQTQTVSKAEKKTEAPLPAKKKPVFDFSEKTIGNREAPLKINIFTSLTCPHCTGVHTQLLPYLKEKYVDKNEALIILTDFPLEQRAMTASMISRCLTGDGYFAFMDTLFENQRTWATAPEIQEALLPYAKLAGLTEEEMVACATDEAASKELVRQRNLAIMRYKIHATPTLVLQIGKEKERLEGAPSRAELDQVIEKLKKTYKGSWPGVTEPVEKQAPSAP
ncbi:MAG: thioredoxin domain-containing protein [Alphaproteobacteria bacterium]|nr:thioredoxin domain-containing protein [Alphaproteobacteria bacterium]